MCFISKQKRLRRICNDSESSELISSNLKAWGFVAKKLLSTQILQVTQPTEYAVSPSRCIALMAYAKAMGVNVFAYSPTLGNRTILSQVKVWFRPQVFPVGSDVTFRIKVGKGVPATFAEMALWEDICPIYSPVNVLLPWIDDSSTRTFEWNMNQLFAENELRFGIMFTNGGAIAIVEMYATFTIAEI